jgi:polyphenol oxidase
VPEARPFNPAGARTTNLRGMRVRRVVTTRAGGVSKAPYDSFNLGEGVGDDPAAVAANRGRLASGTGLGEDRLVWMDEVHGPNATVVDEPPGSCVPDTDALVTAVPGLALIVLTADCVPVLLADPHASVVAAVHAGRRGARAGVVLAALEAMTTRGARLDRVEALLGPAVCGQCYEVPPDMQADVERHLPGSACRTKAGSAGLDLRAGLWRQLADVGVARIGVDPRCTFEDDLLYSYRRDGVTGRIAALTWLDPEPAR